MLWKPPLPLISPLTLGSFAIVLPLAVARSIAKGRSPRWCGARPASQASAGSVTQKPMGYCPVVLPLPMHSLSSG